MHGSARTSNIAFALSRPQDWSEPPLRKCPGKFVRGRRPL
jgi:hypothetical protein